MDSTTGPDVLRRDKKLLLLPAIEPRFLNRPARSLASIPTELIPLILQKSYSKRRYEAHISLSTESCFSKNSLCSVYERNKIGKIVTINYTVRNLRAPTTICSKDWRRKCITYTCITWGSVVVKALRYLSDGPWIDARWCYLGFFPWFLPTKPCALRSNQPLKMSTRDFSWGKCGWCVWLMTYYPCSAESRDDPGP
jgi:hypothetical protein